jgi:hypothetical protein
MIQTVDDYRSVGVPSPTRSNPSKTGAPWLLLSEQEIADWMLATGATTPSAKIARCLTWIHSEWGHGS